METFNVIRPIDKTTDWVPSVTYVHKADGSLRICLDPKDLNNALKRGQHHIPTVDELTHKLANAKVFSILDAKSGYWSVQLDTATCSSHSIANTDDTASRGFHLAWKRVKISSSRLWIKFFMSYPASFR